MKKIKGLSVLQWFLCVIGILILLSFIVLPPAFRAFLPSSPDQGNIVDEEENGESEDGSNDDSSPVEIIDDSQYARIVCTAYDESNPSYRDTLGVLLFHENNQLRIVSETLNRVYPLDTKDNEALFAQDQLACRNVSDAYYQTKGFNYECSSGGNSIYKVKKFDLATFDPSTVDPDDADDIQTKYQLNQNVQQIVSDLESVGYLCTT